eukprot:2742259-Pyramimonas_sp.AAC.1
MSIPLRGTGWCTGEEKPGRAARWIPDRVRPFCRLMERKERVKAKCCIVEGTTPHLNLELSVRSDLGSLRSRVALIPRDVETTSYLCQEEDPNTPGSDRAVLGHKATSIGTTRTHCKYT